MKEKIVKKAVAIKYIENLPAPFVVAKGKENLAQKLIQIAKENDITIIEEKELTDRLIEFSIGDFIPDELYEIVAELLAFVYLTQSKTRKV